MTAPQEPNNPSNLFTPFIEATYNIPEEDDRMKVYLNDKLSKIADTLNDKKIGSYTQDVENFNGNKIIYDSPKITRNGYQYLARIKDYPAGGVIIVNPPPNINEQFVIWQVWGSASKPPTATGAGDGDFFSYYSEGNSKITFTMTDLAITVTTVGLGTGYSGYVVVEYIRNGT
jgi:hypothetical protein